MLIVKITSISAANIEVNPIKKKELAIFCIGYREMLSWD